jgi:hypothetical protein
MQLEELRRILGIDEKKLLARRIEPIGTEYEVVRDALVGMKTIRIAERELTLPGLTRNTDLCIKVLADFKDKKKRNVQPLQYAKTDDIVIEPLRPEQFTVNAVTLDNWVQTALAVGERAVLPSVLQDAGGADRAVTVDDDEVFIITDWVEMKPSTIFTALQAEVDGTPFNPAEMRVYRMTDLQIHELDFPWIADVSLDVDGKVESAGDSELTPFGVHICLGKLVKSIT